LCRAEREIYIITDFDERAVITIITIAAMTTIITVTATIITTAAIISVTSV
jgi:hypothetical protein